LVFKAGKMKIVRTLYIGIFFLLLSCGILDQEPQDKISTDQAFSTESNALKAVNGLYNILQSVYDWRVQVISDLASDITQSIDTWDAFINIDEYKTTQENSEVEDLYIVLYRAIDLANNIISEVPKLKLTAEKENDMLGQAYCIRGLMYFELARFWGGMPQIYGSLGVVIRTKPSNGLDSESYGSRALLEETYEQARFDLEKATELLPETRGTDLLDRSRVVKTTSKALLSRLYLYLREYVKAEEYATEVIQDQRYELVKPFALIFSTKNTKESVFEIQYSFTDISGLRNWYFPASLGGRGGLALHDEFYKELTTDSTDERSKLVALNPSSGTYYPTKYSLAGNADNAHVIRLAELYLIRSEARTYLNNLIGATEDLNSIRNRAGLQDLNVQEQEALLSEILKERGKEFYEEGHRWFDLIRTGNALSKLRNIKRKTGSQLVSLPSEHRQVFPFPGSEVLANPNLIQNEAYK
jgi:starch-binding outer membrane protein, SusD/RagB family